MAKYVYQRYRLNTTYTEQFVKQEIDAISRNRNKFGAYTLSQSSGNFTVENLVTNNNFNGFLVSNSLTPLSFDVSLTTGKYLAKTKDGSTPFGNRSIDIFQSLANYSRGTYIDEIIADDGAYPIDGRQGDYWYVRGEKYAPYPHIKVGGAWKEPTEGYVKVGGVWRPIGEAFVKVGGEWKTLV